MTSEVKSQQSQLQKQVEELKRKLRDASHEKVQALSRCNEDWESKLSAQTNLAMKRVEAEHQRDLDVLRTELQVQMGRSVAEVTGDKEAELKRIRDTLGQARESAVEQAIFLSEEKHIEVMKQREEEWKGKERSLTREISHLSGERQQTNNQLAVLRESDIEKAAIIKRLNFEHEQAVKEMIDMSKQDQSKEYSRFKVIERSAQDREFEVRRLEGKVDVMRIDKELLEKQLLTLRKYYSPDNSPTVTRVMRFSDREREQSRKIRELEDKLRGLPRERGSVTPTPRLSTPTRKISVPTPRFSTPTPDTNSPVSPESEEQLTNFKKKNKELREKVRKLEERCSSLELRNTSLEAERSSEEDYIQREIKLKEKYRREMEQLESEGEALREKIRDLASDENSGQKLEEMALEVERCENRYKKLYLELLMSQQLTSLWSERVDIEAMELVQVELEEKIQELDEIRELNESLNIRVECLKDEFFSVQIQNDKLAEENGFSVSVKEELENELEAVKETLEGYTHGISEKDKEIGELFQGNERLKSQQEGFSLLMDKHIQEIDSMKARELEFNSQREQFESVKEKLLQVEGKERELMAIIQTLEDRNSHLQNELQLKEDELASKAKRKPVRDDKSYGRAEVLFYPQCAKFYRNNNNNNNNNSSEDEENNDSAGNASGEEVIPSLESNDGIDKALIEVDVETAPLSIDQLSNTSSDSQRGELSLNVLTELGTPVLTPHTPKPELRVETDSDEDGGNSIGEWSHTSEENIGTTPQSPNLSPIPTPIQTPMKQNPEVYLIRYSYDPLLSSPNPHPEQELSLTAGGYVYVYGTEDEDGFYVGKLPGGGKHGLVPSNFVEKIQHTSSSSEAKPDEDLNPIEPLESAKGPLELYLRSQSDGDPPLYNYNSNLSNIIEEDESLLEDSNLTKISGNISSTESIKLQTSNESLDKISELHSSNPPSPRHILTPSDIKVSYTPGDIEVNWEQPSCQDITGVNVTTGDDTLTYIESGDKNSFLLSNLDCELSADIHTLTLSAVTQTGTSEGVAFTVDRREVPAPYDLNLCEDENGLRVSWQLPDTKSLSSPFMSFQIYLNGELRTVDYSEFILDKSVSISEIDLLRILEFSSDGKVSISVRSVLSDGRQSQLSDALEVPSRLSTSSEATPIRMISLDSDSTGDGSRRSSSSESEVLEVFRKSSLESDQILNQFRVASQQEVSEVVSKPPIDPRTALTSLGGRQRQSFTPNEDDLFTELEAQGAANITPSPIFSIDEAHSQSDSEDDGLDSPHYTEIRTMDATVTYYVALYDYHPKEEPAEGDYQPELQLEKGEVVAVYGPVDEDGFLQAQVDDKVGLVPYNLVEKIDISDLSGETSSALLFQATKQAFPAKKYTALYSYNPRVDSPNSEDMDDELSFKSGASISIYGDVQEDGFYIGEQNGEMGFVPSNFVEPNDHIKPPQSLQPLDTSSGSKGASPLEPHKTRTILAKTKGIFKSLSKKS